jgi:hypothetical protein
MMDCACMASSPGPLSSLNEEAVDQLDIRWRDGLDELPRDHPAGLLQPLGIRLELVQQGGDHQLRLECIIHGQVGMGQRWLQGEDERGEREGAALSTSCFSWSSGASTCSLSLACGPKPHLLLLTPTPTPPTHVLDPIQGMLAPVPLSDCRIDRLVNINRTLLDGLRSKAPKRLVAHAVGPEPVHE